MKLESYHEMKAFCDENKLLQSGQRVLVAFSGGADSVYLTLALQELSKEWDFALELLHVNHQIRGEEAGRDEAFCRSFAAQQGLKLHVCSGDVPKMGQEQKCSLEEAARKYRYQCIEELVEREDFDRVAVAHHQDDQAETFSDAARKRRARYGGHAVASWNLHPSAAFPAAQRHCP